MLAPYHKSARHAKKGLKLIHEILMDNETPISTGDAFNKKPGAWMVTDQRILFAYKSLFSSQILDIPRDKIASLEIKSGPMVSKVIIKSSGGDMILDHLKPKPAQEIKKALS